MLQMMIGISAIDAQPIASALSEIPGPALPVTARYPPYEHPRAIETDASSSSAWTKIPPYFGSSRRSVSITDVKETFAIAVWFDVVGFIKQYAAFTQETDVVLVTILVKRDQKICFVPRR